VSNLDSDSLTKGKLFPYHFFKSAVYHVCSGRLVVCNNLNTREREKKGERKVGFC